MMMIIVTHTVKKIEIQVRRRRRRRRRGRRRRRVEVTEIIVGGRGAVYLEMTQSLIQCHSWECQGHAVYQIPPASQLSI